MAKSNDPVQIWGGLRVKDRENRYVIGVRGGVEPEISLARYAANGKSLFLGWAPLDPVPNASEWITVKVVAIGNRFLIFYNNEELPRLNIEDKNAPWQVGGVALGGGWLPVDFETPAIRPLNDDDRARIKAIGEKNCLPPEINKETARQAQRSAYKGITISQLPKERGTISLDGEWLFIPDQDLPANSEASTLAAQGADDHGWHIMPVPAFWTPTIGWLHGEGDLPGLKGMAASRGPSDALVAEEYARLDKLTFNWRKTKSAWYRQHLNLPANIDGKRLELVFDAIAKTSEIWVNGQRAGSNIGMFRQVRCDITPYVKPGRNVIAVHNIGNPDRAIKNAKSVADVAVTVEVTYEMLNSLPHGMTDNNSGGIWQPVYLEVTSPVKISDVFIQPKLDSATAEVQFSNGKSKDAPLSLDWKIVDLKDGSTLTQSREPNKVTVPAGGTSAVKIATPTVAPKLWTPATPNLYELVLTVRDQAGDADQLKTRFGFRTFSVSEGKLLLNGKPYWLRGGNHFPVTLRPNDGALAKKFTQLAKEGNVDITRSHAIPFTRPWFEAADEIGMGISYEGTWPWLMLNGPVPDPELIKIWKDEFSALIKQHRNHPSLFFWTVNNEMKFPIIEKLDDTVLLEKWRILDDMIRTMRQLDPTRPVVADSAYIRKEAEKRSGALRAEHQFDDGDIDDAHRYYGWYNESPFYLFDGKFGQSLHTPNRPLISQEMSTGYPRNDDWPSRSYQFSRYVPQALVGNYAFEQNDPSIFIRRQAFMTKELAEVIRRTNRDNANGILHFAYLTWFTNVWKADSITPKPTYHALKKALEPILVSAELYGRHFYAGMSINRRVCIANDSRDFRDLKAARLQWEIRAGESTLAKGHQDVDPIPYYSNQWVNLEIPLPAALPQARVDAQLVFSLEDGGRIISRNDYDIILANRSWTNASIEGYLFDPGNKSKETTQGLPLRTISTLANLDPNVPLVVGDCEALVKIENGAQTLKAFAEAGGRVLLLQPGQALCQLFPDAIKSYRKTQGEIVTMSIPESPVFDDLQPLDTAWFEMGGRTLPQACSGTFEVDTNQPGITTLATECKLHPDIPKESFFKEAGTPIVEFKLGKGSILASEMMLSTKDRDPIAGRLLANMLHSLKSESTQRHSR